MTDKNDELWRELAKLCEQDRAAKGLPPRVDPRWSTAPAPKPPEPMKVGQARRKLDIEIEEESDE